MLSKTDLMHFHHLLYMGGGLIFLQQATDLGNRDHEHRKKVQHLTQDICVHTATPPNFATCGFKAGTGLVGVS